MSADDTTFEPTFDAGPEPSDGPADQATAPAFEPSPVHDGTIQHGTIQHGAIHGGATLTTPLDLLHDVDMEVTVELGRTTMPIRDLLALQPGMVVEIDRAAGGPIDVLVNGRLIACGEVVVIDEEFGIRITEIVSGANN